MTHAVTHHRHTSHLVQPGLLRRLWLGLTARRQRQHLARLRGPKGLPPREWLRFSRRWAGPLWPVYAASPFVRRTARWARATVTQRG